MHLAHLIPSSTAATHFVGAALCVCLGGPTAPAAPPSFSDQVQPILTEFCIGCHGAKKQEGDVRLDQLDPDLVAGNDAERWHQALNLINRGDMPPADAPQPDAPTLDVLVNAIQLETCQTFQKTLTEQDISTQH